MLTVSASKRATVEEICSHWWVDEGFSEPCLEVAEALANQTPVRLDLLLSLAPKHINSEHMLIQPEEDDNSARVSVLRVALLSHLPDTGALLLTMCDTSCYCMLRLLVGKEDYGHSTTT